MGQQHWGLQAVGQLGQAEAKQQPFVQGASGFQQGDSLAIAQHAAQLIQRLLRRHQAAGGQLLLGGLWRAGGERRQQGARRQIKDFSNEAHVVVDQRIALGVLLNAGGERLAVAQALPLIAQLLHQAHHQGRFATEGFAGTHQKSGTGVAHGSGLE